MVKLSVRLLALALILGAMPGCKNKPDQSGGTINPKLVTNPITASGKKAATSNLPVMVFEQTKHDFGMMVQGEKLSYTYKFTNTGGSDVLISNVSATCGCTIPDWTKTPVKPGEQGKVEVIFNSAGKSGSINKAVSVLSNCQPNTIDLEFTAEIYVPNSKK